MSICIVLKCFSPSNVVFFMYFATSEPLAGENPSCRASCRPSPYRYTTSYNWAAKVEACMHLGTQIINEDPDIPLGMQDHP